ncbi:MULTISPECIES: cytochrome P450 [Streptomyces]|nr:MULTISPECIES: cytochrome P450 [Streptomyces]MCC4318465.1 cytochrome P450 [Streptomyces malaysiensis]MCD9590966.1 cytochrome P450 [Streptomyces sp. 8ZJF_21]MCM3810768.1 cytochrome P450 [Streptomyces sp. DR7-3]MCQ6249819.1 cytochrome P450 [Streptomyces malaysiensis]UHH20658.1 cytochrome P450 [Streptomyces sp. HNM0561]
MTNHPAAGPVPPPGCPAHAGPATAVSDAGPRAAVPMYGPEFAADPHGAYTRMRATFGAIAPVELSPGVYASLVTSYQLGLEILRDTERFAKDPRGWRAMRDGTVGLDNPVAPMMMYRPNALFADGEAHVRLRGAITDSLDRVDPHALSEYVERSAETLIDAFASRGEAELITEYASVIPLLVFNQLFGARPADGPKLVETMMKLFDSGEDAAAANDELLHWISGLLAEKRRQPAADVTSWLMAHPSQLADDELMQQMILLMAAGTDPEQNLIANALRLLLSDDRFAGELSGGSMPVEDALDEVLWNDPPMANYGTRFPRYDCDVAGVRLRKGDPVLISYAAANHEAALASDRRSGNRAHLAWSAGAHRCPAERPARVIASVAIERLLDRLPDMELAVPAERLTWRTGPFSRALATLPVRFPAQATSRTGPSAASVSESTRFDETSGGSQWNPVPSFSTPPAATSPERQPESQQAARRRLLSFLTAWWRGQ